MRTYTERALAMRPYIEQAAQGLDDKTASEAPNLLRKLAADGRLVKAGTRINWNGIVKRAAVDLWDTAENMPDNSPTIWEDICYKQGFRIIPDTITAGLAFAKGEKGWWGDDLYESLLESNVWTPAAYPSAWQKVNN